MDTNVYSRVQSQRKTADVKFKHVWQRGDIICYCCLNNHSETDYTRTQHTKNSKNKTAGVQK